LPEVRIFNIKARINRIILVNTMENYSILIICNDTSHLRIQQKFLWKLDLIRQFLPENLEAVKDVILFLHRVKSQTGVANVRTLMILKAREKQGN